MADNDKDKEVTPSRGADWEVVQLTESTYAAAPNPQEICPDDVRTGQESSGELFMSGHFVFPPREHDDPIEPDRSEILREAEKQDKGDRDDVVHEERKLVESDVNSPETEFFEAGSTLSVPAAEGSSLQEVHSVPDPKSTYLLEPKDTSGTDDNSTPKHSKSSEDDGSGIPFVGWWKRHALSLYHHAKESNTFWSIFVAAALTGIVILGKRWYRVNNEKVNKILCPVNRLKVIIDGGR